MTSDASLHDRVERSKVDAYEFGRYRLDLNRGELLRDGESVAVRPRTFEVLRYLVSNAGKVVSRDELFEAVWPNQVVSDDSLTQCLSEIRKALHDENRDMARTVPRRGYRFEAEVRRLPDSRSGSAFSSPIETGSERDRMPSRWTVLGFAALASLLALLWWRFEFRGPADAERPWNPVPASIAVLPFEDESLAGDQAYLAEGIAEEILNALTRSPELTVIARNSSFSFRNAEMDVAAIARRLDVGHVLEGSVGTQDDRVRVTTRLIDGRTGTRLWSQTLEGRLGEDFAVERTVAERVAEVLEVRLRRAVGIGNADGGTSAHYRARERFLQGKLFYARRTKGDVLRAQQRFEAALEIDPRYADAWVALAATYNLRRASTRIPDEDRLSPREALEGMRTALEKAIAIDPHHPEALWRLAGILWWEGEIERAIRLRQRAVQLGSNHAVVQAMIAGAAHDTGHLQLALPFSRRATVLDPISPSLLFNHALWLYTAGRFGAAERAAERVAELAPADRDRTLALLTWIRIAQAQFDAAAEFALQLDPGPDFDQAEAILGYFRGQHSAANRAIERLMARPADQAVGRLGIVYAMRGEPDEAFFWLSRATEHLISSSLDLRSRRGHLVTLQQSPLLESLHDDPRWTTWMGETQELVLSDEDRDLVAMIREYRDRHPELYSTLP